jgi:hypothetical protein
VLACDILQCTPWLEFGDSDLTFSDTEAEPVSRAPPCSHWALSPDRPGPTPAIEDAVVKLLSLGGVSAAAVLLFGGDGGVGCVQLPSITEARATLQHKLADDEALMQSFVAELHMCLHDATTALGLSRITVHGSEDLLPSPPTSVLTLLLSVPSLQQLLLDQLVALLLAAVEANASECAGAAPPSPPAVMPPLVSAAEAAVLAPPLATRAAVCAARWDAICGGSIACQGSGVAPRHVRSSWSPAVLFALVQPQRFLSTFLALSPLLITAGTPPIAPPREATIRELVAVLSGATSGADVWALKESRAAADPLASVAPTADHVQRILLLLPTDLLPYFVMAVPVILDPQQHTMASGVILSALADAAAAGTEAEAEVQLAVCTALSMLHIEPVFAEATLTEALASLPRLPPAELPGALALVMRLAGESEDVVEPTVAAVRSALRALGSNVSLGLLQTLAFSVLQHPDLAAVYVRTVAEEAAAVEEVPERRDSGNSSVQVDVDVMLEVMQLPSLRAAAEAAVEVVVRKGLIDAGSMRLLLERRRLQRTLFCALAAQLLAEEGASGPGHPTSSPTTTTLPVPSKSPSGAGRSGGSTWLPLSRLRPTAAAALAAGPDPDGCDNLLSLAAALSSSPSPTVKHFSFQLYLQIFALWPSQQARARLILFLVHRASSTTSLATAAEPPPWPVEARALVAITEQWPKLGSSALVSLLDLLSRHSAAHSAHVMQIHALRSEVATSADEVEVMKGQVQQEALRSAQEAAEQKRVAEASSKAHEQEKAALREEITSLQDQVRVFLRPVLLGGQGASLSSRGMLA